MLYYLPMTQFSCQAILFDLDGVLVDSTRAVERVWRKWAHENQLDIEKVLEHAHGRRTIETIRIVAPHLDAEEEYSKVEQMEVGDKEGVVMIPGALELLRRLPAGRYAVVTSATRALATARLQYANLFVPDRLVSADDVLKGKPSPEPYLKGAALINFSANKCLVFEDTPAGIESARAAGMQVIALTTTYPGSELSGADALVESLVPVHVRFENETLQLNVS
jgi:mannitol-1-/sugar-/sorbitol-6-phosphatase